MIPSNSPSNQSRTNSVAPSESLIAEAELKTQVDDIWKVNQTKEKFVELDDMMARRVETKRLLQTVVICRILVLGLTGMAAAITSYFYVGDNMGKDHSDEFNCLLPS